MDPTSVPPELTAWVVANMPNGVFWLSVAGVLATWWRSAASHLCEFIAKTLAIAEKFAENGLDVRLQITNLDGDPPEKRTNREEF